MIAWIAGAGGLALAGMAFWVNVQSTQIEGLEAQVVGYKKQVSILTQTNRVNRMAVDACRVVNAENARARDEALDRADQAEQRIRILEQDADATITIIQEERDAFRTNDDEECRTLGEPLPIDFADWVFDD